MSSLLSWFYKGTSLEESLPRTTSSPSSGATSVPNSNDHDEVKATTSQAKIRENESDSITVSSEDSLPSSPDDIKEFPTCSTSTSNVNLESIPIHGNKQAILQTLQSWAQSWNAGNFDDYINSYANDRNVRYISSSLMATKRNNEDDIVVMGKDAIRNVFEDVFERARKYKQQKSIHNDDEENSPTKFVAGELVYTNIDVQLIRDDQAFVFGRYRYDLVDIEDSGVFTLQMVMNDGTWRILTEHSSATPKRKP
jgi:hypothetical protein